MAENRQLPPLQIDHLRWCDCEHDGDEDDAVAAVDDAADDDRWNYC